MAENGQKTGKKRGRPRWVPPNLDLVKGLAMQGLTNEKIARTLKISPATLYNKKREYLEFLEAIKNGVAEGEAVVTSRLFEMAKKGEAWAVCFYLKSRCNWRDTPDPAGVNVNIGVADEEREAALQRQRDLFKLATPEEIAMYRRFLQRLLTRQQQQANRGAVETTAEPVQSNSKGDGPEGAG